MIRYDLKCADGHAFDAWFASSATFDDQVAKGFVTCPYCGTDRVEKSLMAPRVPAKSNGKADAQPMISTEPRTKIEAMVTELRKEIEKNSDYVGDQFAAEARKIHLGESDTRAIYGEATNAEAKSLIEDGIPVAPIPKLPKRDA